MKKRNNFFNFKFDCEHKELFEYEGVDRLLKINTLSFVSRTLICSFYGRCDACPLHIIAEKGSNVCVDASSEKEVLYALALGGHFVTKEESEDVRRNS